MKTDASMAYPAAAEPPDNDLDESTEHALVVQELKKRLLDRTAELYAVAGGGVIPSRQIGCLAQAVAELAIEMGYRPKDPKTDDGGQS